ncbi:neutral/alkaline non-lysosomal ceramidase N-terminal domain-containing protein [Devosia chinhatensis]|uniref:Neutral/alkaline non-lysosomal ceramidase n=1 Tax=Devosia chinhatensis TaxID=429727 RepID=A0A0F5FM54_9HYPH|nr:neutral/alkaline non-lysosomal ceramidase N-terminal domain-containing protein [Devosia chinhatensis]KKB09277.1 neutral/alkaline non-lysosomal ceramidase [Devosia chinhatensis]
MIMAGVASVDITPPAGLSLAGFAARTQSAQGVHDALTARAIVVEDTAIVVLDVIGLHEDMAARIRKRSGLDENRIIVAATHTHGAPVSMQGRLGRDADPGFLQQMEDGAVKAIRRAWEGRRPASLSAGMGSDPGVAWNRRHADGPLDHAVPVIRIRDAEGSCFAVMTSYACHPVVLAADNLLMTADYPYYVRRCLEEAYPGAVALFLTGCAGDANTGHTAQASWTLAANAQRTFATAERLGVRIAEAALVAPEGDFAGPVDAGHRDLDLEMLRLETESLSQLAEQWRLEAASAELVRATLLGHWIEWAERFEAVVPGSWRGRVSLLDWCGIPIVAMPGEIFSETGLFVRACCNGLPAFVLAYAEGNPGYIPPSSEYQFGGYEVTEAHRFIGMPGAFAPGSAEALAEAACGLIKQRHLTAQPVA